MIKKLELQRKGELESKGFPALPRLFPGKFLEDIFSKPARLA
jgi:hypothetical protein